MKKRLPLFLILPLLFACSGTGTSSPSITSTSFSSSFSSSKENPSTSSSVSSIDEKEYWDVSSTDVSHIDPENRLICFTFDDGPISYTANKLLDVFDKFNSEYKEEGFEAHGTFFYKGINVVDANQETIERALQSGFQIGNHTVNHKHLEDLPAREIKSEVQGTIDALKNYTSLDSALVRLPFGTYNETVLDTVNVPMINWTQGLDTLDWSGKTASEIYDTVMNNLVEGGIVLMHEGYETTIQAVKNLLPSLYERGYQVVTINEYCKVRNIRLEPHKVYTYLGDL